MKLWKKLNRRAEGWVERRRRFQKMFADKIPKVLGEPVPALVGVPASDKPKNVTDRGDD